MLITRTPFRMSFFGGGTDYYDYFAKYGGSVLSTTIDKYCYLSMRTLPPFFDYKSQFTYSRIERFNTPEEVCHPLMRAALRFLPVERIQVAYDADLPAASGIGSSSSFAVGLVQGLHAMRNEYPDLLTIAKEAIYLEREMCREAGGVQDQLAAAYGGFNKMIFTADGYQVIPLGLDSQRKQDLLNHLMLVFTGFTHFSGAVAEEQTKNIDSRIQQLDEMKSMVDVAESILLRGDLDDFGRLLHHSWELKRTLSNRITSYEIDLLYTRMRNAGAIGGKLLGAGGGGFLLMYVPVEKQAYLKKVFKDFRIVPFHFENSGTKIIYHNDIM